MVKEPTFIWFSNNSDFLAIGFKDGEILLFRPLIRRTQEEDPYSINLENMCIIKEREIWTSVLSINFSADSSLMSVSYDNI